MSTAQPAPDVQQDSSLSPADHTAAFKFLDFIFEGVTHGFAEFQYFNSGRKPKRLDRPTYLSLPLEYKQVADHVLSRNGQRMITVGVAPRCRVPGGTRAGRNQDVLQVGCIWANLDNAKAPGGAIDIIGQIKGFPLRPSVVVNSGYGYHVYYVLHKPLHAEELLTWNELTGKLRAVLSVDVKANLCEVMRLPGTLNVKELHPVPCEIWEESSSWLRYSTAEVLRAVEEISHRKLPVSSSFSPEVLRQRGIHTDLIEAIVTGRVGAQLRSMPAGDSGRDVWIASALLSAGFSEEEIKSIFRGYPDGCGSKWAKKRDGGKYLELTLNKALVSSVAQNGYQEYDRGTQDSELPPGYFLNEGAIWFNPPTLDADKKPRKPVKVSNSFISISEIQENIDTGEISLSVTFEYLDKTRFISIPRSTMADSRKLVTALAGAGAPVTSNNARLVTAYLAAYEHTFASVIRRKKVTSRFGRGDANGPFFLPGLYSAIEFAPCSPGDAALYRAYSSRCGSLGGWLEAMHALSDEALMIPQVAVLASFIPPLQRKLQIPNFILDLHGNSSTGKSTSLKLAASVYGRPHDPDSLVMQWINTKVAVEQVAGLCSELPIYLDDAQHCPSEIKRSLIYMIANGRGKGRSSGGGGILATTTWHTVALSTSEEPLYESSPHEGARGRLLPIGGMTPPFRPGAGSLVLSLERAATHNHGYAGEAYIRHLNGWTEADWSRWQNRYSRIRAELQGGGPSNLIGRVSGYIAAIQLAAEVATPLLGLRFKPDVVGAWLRLHLDEQQSAQNMVLIALRELSDFYVANVNRFARDGHYAQEKRKPIYGASKKHQYVGFLRSTVEAIFKRKRWNPAVILNKLAEAGALHATEDDRHTKKVSIAGVQHRMVCVKWSAIFGGEVDTATFRNVSDTRI